MNYAEAPPVEETAPGTESPWRILVVDDDAEVHAVTRLALSDLCLGDRPLEILGARSAAEARALWLRQCDIALVLLDVVMETDLAGLDFVRFVRDEQGDDRVRIVLRTGQPGQAPALEVLKQYEIDDYRTKTDLTYQRLNVVVSTALRTYRLLRERDERQRALEASNVELRRLNRVYSMLSGIDALIVRARSQEQLFQGACRVAVEKGLFAAAWIGLLRGGELETVARHGAEGTGGQMEAQPDAVQGDGGPGLSRALAASAMRELRPGIVNEVPGAPAPGRDAAGGGCRAMAALPLVSGGKALGCLGLCAPEPGFFDEGETRVLAEIAGSLSYAMEHIAHEERLDYLAYFDPLTRLANRRLFSDRVSQFVRGARLAGHGLTLMMLDLTNFKSVNDTLGMAAGDELLRRLGRRLARYAGGVGRVARIGGDRFAAVLTELRTAGAGTMLRERMWEGLGRPYKLGRQQVRLSVRIGIAVFPDNGDDAESLIQNAEAALKEAKASGDHILFYTQQMSDALRHRLRLEGQLRRALEQSEFVLHYQPKVDLRSNTICGAEALLRWNSPELGLVQPAQFVPLLEESGLIIKVGRWVLQQAVHDQQRWSGAGLSPPRVAVNLSPLQLRPAGFVDEVRAALRGAGGPAASMELEVTESMLLQDNDRHVAKLGELRDMGVVIAIDDFGVGYSSLSRLSRLPVDAVKIDRSFIEAMTDDPDSTNIVATIIALAHSMNLRVVAEGVDSAEQLKFLRLLSCDEVQGYLFSPAVPADEFARMLREGGRLAAGGRGGA